MTESGQILPKLDAPDNYQAEYSMYILQGKLQNQKGKNARHLSEPPLNIAGHATQNSLYI
jgi:hypothetical protein